jgi:hypothetical protein
MVGSNLAEQILGRSRETPLGEVMGSLAPLIDSR